MSQGADTVITAEDELAIRNLVARCGDAVCRRDPAAWQATWVQDCEWDLGGTVVHGSSEAARLWQRAMDNFSWLAQVHLSGQVLDVAGEIRGIWYLLELQEPAEGEMRMVLGRYEDTYARTPDGWRFARRRFQASYRGRLHSETVTPVLATLTAATDEPRAPA